MLSPYPFDESAVSQDESGVRFYTELEATLGDMLDARVHAHGDRPAVIMAGGSALSYRELRDAALKCAGGIRERGVTTGDRVAIQLENCLEWVVAYWAIIYAGAVVVPVNIRLSAAEIDYIVDNSGAALVIDDVAALPQGAPYRDDSTPDSLSAVFYTSGTTGRPKGAVSTHRNLLNAAENQRRLMAATIGELDAHRSLVSVPLFHVTGCNSQMVSVLHAGGSVVLLPAFSVEGLLSAVQNDGVDLVVGVPTMIWRVIHDPRFGQYDTSGLRGIMVGGAPTPADLLLQFMEVFPNVRWANGFGATESTSVTFALTHEYVTSHPSSVGVALPGVDVRIHNADDQGIGEIQIRGANVMAHYWGHTRDDDFTDGDWLGTGDLGRMDNDGFVYIVDRLKDMISRGGEKIFSVELENALAAAPGVFELAVVGVPDPEMGERIGLVAVAEPGRALHAAEIAAFAQSTVANYKVPEFIAVSDEPLPRNAGGKIRKRDLRTAIDWTATYQPRAERERQHPPTQARV